MTMRRLSSNRGRSRGSFTTLVPRNTNTRRGSNDTGQNSVANSSSNSNALAQSISMLQLSPDSQNSVTNLNVTSGINSDVAARNPAAIDTVYTSTIPSAPDRSTYRILIFCAKAREADMVLEVLDSNEEDTLDPFSQEMEGDEYHYNFGTLAGHRVVVVYLARMGNISSQSAAMTISKTFTKIEFAFVVGFCGVAPHVRREDEDDIDIFLGDLLISTEIYNYSRGHDHPGGIQPDQRYQIVYRNSNKIDSLFQKLSTLKSQRKLQASLQADVAMLQEKLGSQISLVYPGFANDVLHHPDNIHTHKQANARCTECNWKYGWCKKFCNDLGCDADGIVERTPKTGQSTEHVPRIVFGAFGSAEFVVRSGRDRDNWVDELGLVAFEMEGVGVAQVYPTIVVKAACDYADSHKNKGWQNYAAAVAAAGLKALLKEFKPSDFHEVAQVNAKLHHLLVRLQTDSTLLSRSSFPSSQEYWYHLTTKGWKVYDEIYTVMDSGRTGKLKVETLERYLVDGTVTLAMLKTFWQRFRQGLSNPLVKSHILALLYMLHVEVYNHGNLEERPHLEEQSGTECLTNDRTVELESFATWTECCDCKVQWNFAGRRWGIFDTGGPSMPGSNCLIYARCQAYNNGNQGEIDTESTKWKAADFMYRQCYRKWAFQGR